MASLAITVLVAFATLGVGLARNHCDEYNDCSSCIDAGRQGQLAFQKSVKFVHHRACKWCIVTGKCTDHRDECRVWQDWAGFDPLVDSATRYQVTSGGGKFDRCTVERRAMSAKGLTDSDTDAHNCLRWASNETDEDMSTECEAWILRKSIAQNIRRAMLGRMGKAFYGHRGPQLVDDPTWSSPEENVGLCDVFRQFGKGHCYAQPYGMGLFQALRGSRKWDSSAIDQFTRPLGGYAPGAGKSGSSFYMTKRGPTEEAKKTDPTFFIKNLRSDKLMNEAKNLKMLMSGEETLVDHFRADSTFEADSNSELKRASLLNRPLNFLKLRLPWQTKDKFFFVMSDATGGIKGLMDKTKCNYKQYDLKGASRNQEKTSAADAATGINGDFAREEGALALSNESCGELIRRIDYDVAFLSKYDLIDYSVFVAKAWSKNHNDPCDATCAGPNCFEGTNGEVYNIEIIDFLNDYTKFKHLESVFHRGKFNNYAEKIQEYVASICPYIERSTRHVDSSSSDA